MGKPSACDFKGPASLCPGKDLQNDPLNCGQCGHSCAVLHLAGTCSQGVCDGPCAPGYGDCNNNRAQDGCEAAVAANDIFNCGGCGLVCSAIHITAVCTAGACVGPCEAGYSDCDNDKQSGGCETWTQGDDPKNCGGCGKLCQGTCKAGVCN